MNPMPWHAPSTRWDVRNQGRTGWTTAANAHGFPEGCSVSFPDGRCSVLGSLPSTPGGLWSNIKTKTVLSFVKERPSSANRHAPPGQCLLGNQPMSTSTS